MIVPLKVEALYTRCRVEQFDFETTATLDDVTEIVGQVRAVAAVRFGIGIDREGYNIYALGPVGTGKHAMIEQFLQARAAQCAAPSDWCYVYHFEEAHRPRALALPPGMGGQFRADMKRLVEDLRSAIPAAFENDEYRMRRQLIQDAFQERERQVFETLRQRARAQGLSVMRTPNGLSFAPLMENGEVMPPEQFQRLPDDDRHRIEREVEDFQKASQDIFRQVPQWEKELREQARTLNREVTQTVVETLVGDLRQTYADLPEVLVHLDAVCRDVIDNAGDFLPAEDKEGEEAKPPGEMVFLRRYRVNAIVDHSHSTGAPVVFEDNPTYQNLVGRVEHLSEMGVLQTDFNLIKAGALHRANGGYLVLDALKVLSNPYAWDGLKRALQAREIRIESLGQMFGMISTVSLEPQPIPLSVKVVLLGDRYLYYLLQQADPEFGELFKVSADCDEEMDRNPDGERVYARLMATLARRERLRPLDKSAVGRAIEHSARLVGDSRKLSMRVRGLVDLLIEADYWAAERGVDVLTEADVQAAIDARVFRSERVQRAMEEQVLRETVLIDTSGEAVGQINGLSVLQLGDYAFGRPSRITAQVRMGRGEVVDIEREVDLSGPLHSKGVLILSAFLAGRYAADRPLSLSASLVFEQSYGGVDGDSASSTELYALLSAIAGMPLKQSLAVTGSVNQYGVVQAIGGVNQKIEGFFDVCKARGLTGDQGVLIPSSNVPHLMLRKDVVAAAGEGLFHIYPVATVDEGIELLTGMAAGAPDGDGQYPEDTVNGRVQRRLTELSEKRARFVGGSEEK